LLVAADDSECSAIIPDVLADWGAFQDLPAVAVSVAPVDSPVFKLMVSLYTLGEDPLRQQQQELVERHREHAAMMSRRLAERGIQAQADVREGDAADEILKAAAEREADLIVTGSRCLHGLDRWLLGSVARNVLLHAHCSVLIVRRKGVARGP
jgi:nucleotide-binding universal stress UspA family protein